MQVSPHEHEVIDDEASNEGQRIISGVQHLQSSHPEENV